jgi:transposase
LEYRYQGGQSQLNTSQEAELKICLKTNTKRTAKEVANHIEKTYGVKFSIVGVAKLLHRLGFTYKKPKLIPGKADPAKQAAFLKTYTEIKTKLKPQDRMYFIDSSHPQHSVQPDYGWILKGKQNDIFVKTNSGRERLNLNGAYNFQDKEAVVLEEKTINAQALINLLNTIKKKQKTGNVYIILDNAKHHHARLVRRWRLHHPRFKLLFLPTYSPNLNLIERLWRFFHQKVTWNHYFETFGEFKQATLKFFKNLKTYEKELSTLLTDNFQLYPAQKVANLS